MHFTYIIQNRFNGKVYIGYTNDWAKRWERHRKANRPGLIAQAIRKHGPEAFLWIVSGRFESKEDALAHESELIAEFKSNVCRYGRDHGYNMTDGGDMPPWRPKGWKHKPETNQKIVAALRARPPISEETRAKLVAAQKLRPDDFACKLSMNDARTIREEYASGKTSIRKLAKKYNVSVTPIKDIVHNRRYLEKSL